MKKSIGILFTLAFWGTIVFFASCNKADPTTGILHLSVYDSSGLPVVGINAHLSTINGNLASTAYSNTGWTDKGGNGKFQNLIPGYYRSEEPTPELTSPC